MSATSNNISQYLTSLYGLGGKTALVTGATRGLGRQMAGALASAGADLIVLVRDPGAETVRSLVSAVEDMRRQIRVVEADLQDRRSYLGSVEQLLVSASQADDARSSSPGPDIFVHSAGLQHRESSLTFPAERWDAILEVNLTAGFLIAQALARHWITRLPPRSRGFPAGQHKSILLLGSVLSRGPGSLNIPAYISTKGGISQLVKGLSNEWAQHGINVNAVAPGYFATELTSGIRGEQEREMLSRVPVWRWGRGRETEEDGEGGQKESLSYGDLEGTVVWLCGRGAEFVSGETVIVDGGFSGR